MEKLNLELPAMYGDHHVIEVRRILLEIPGIEDVYASSAFHVVEVQYDPVRVASSEIISKLEEAGYTGDLPTLVETGAAPAWWKPNSNGSFRHATVYEQTRQAVSFAQNVSYLGRPLWPCPGMGVIKTMNEES